MDGEVPAERAPGWRQEMDIEDLPFGHCIFFDADPLAAVC